MALLIFGLAPLSSALADDGSDASSFIRQFIERSIEIRTSDALTPDQKVRERRMLLEQCYDVSNVPKVVLGRYWEKATVEQQESYRSIFEDYLLASYGPKFDSIADRLSVSAAEADGNTVVVHTVDPRTSQATVVVDWLLIKASDGGWRIADVRVNGASSVEVMRQDFTAVLRANNGSIDALLSALRHQIEQLRKTPA